MRKALLATFAAIIVIGLGSWVVLRGRYTALPPSPGEPRRAQEFILKDYEGREVKLSDFRGKVALVNAWASWCPFCKEELKDFAAVKQELGDDVVIIAVDRAETLETAKRYSDALGVGDGVVFLLDPDDSFYQAIGGFSMPETIFVDRDGLIRRHRRGPMQREEIRRRIEDMLGL